MLVAMALSHPLLAIVERRPQTSPRVRHLVGGHSGREFHDIPSSSAALERAGRLADALAVPITTDRALHFFFQDPPRSAEFPQRVEVAEHGHVRIGGIGLVGIAARALVGTLRRAHQREPRPTHEHLGVAARRDDAEIEASRHLLRRADAGEEGVVPRRPRRRKYLRERAGEQRLDLIVRLPNGGRGSNDLRTNRIRFQTAHAQGVDRRFVEADHRAEGAGNQMQLVLDHEIGRRQRPTERPAFPWRRRAVEPVIVVAFRTTEQHAGVADPRQRREFVNRRDQECRQPAIDRLVHRDDGQWSVAAEVAFEIRTGNAQVVRRVRIRFQREGRRREARAAPGTVLQRDRRRIAVGVLLKSVGLATRRVRVSITPSAHDIRRRRLAHPQANLERPVTVALRVALAFKLQGADQARRARKLIERQQTQRVAHHHAHTRTVQCIGVPAMSETPQHHGERGKTEIRLRLAAARREEQEIDDPAIRVVRIGETGQIQQDERELEGTPFGVLYALALSQRETDGPIGHAERIERVRVFGEHGNAAFDPLGSNARIVQQCFRGIASSVR